MAHVKAGGTTKGNRDAEGKRLGVKVFGGSKVLSGNIIVRQRGTKFTPGKGTKVGSDDTLYAIKSGTVLFKKRFNDTIVEVEG
jgi:large subunit ribosomal protein L27